MPKRGKKMKKSKIYAVVLLALLMLFAAACSKIDKPDEIQTSTRAEISEYDISQAVEAFGYLTENSTEAHVQVELSASKVVRPGVEESTREVTQTIIATIATTAAPTTQTAKQTVKVTINEGDSLTQIFKKLDENGVADFDELMETAQTYDYSYYPLVAKIPSSEKRCFKLEGYLFPDTYEFYTNQKPQDAIGKFLRNGKARITDSMVSQASSLGYTMDEVMTVASIIEKEGAKSSEVAKIAAVIYNRLEAGMKLQMDSTIYYIERNVKPYLTGDINRYNSYYNTYKCSALPAGPISNPGMRTINAALYPADVDYLYFCHDENANYYYAETYEEHLENLELAGIE